MKRLLALHLVWLALLTAACAPRDTGEADRILYDAQLAYALCAGRSALSYADSNERLELVAQVAMSACPNERTRFRYAVIDLSRRYPWQDPNNEIARIERFLRDEVTALVVGTRLDRDRARGSAPPPRPGMF